MVRRFKEIKHTATIDRSGKEVKLNMFIPGVNSGVYTAELHMSFMIIEPGFFKKKKSGGSINLSINDVIELRDELNEIIKVAERQGRINKIDHERVQE